MACIMTSSHTFISFSSEGQQHSRYVFNKRLLWGLTPTIDVPFLKPNWYAKKKEKMLARQPLGRFPLKCTSSFRLMPTLTYLKRICRRVQNLAGSLMDLGNEWCGAVCFHRYIFPQRGRGWEGATRLACRTWWWEGRGGGGGLLCGYSSNWRLHEQDIKRRSEPSQPPASDVCQSRRYIFCYKHNDWCVFFRGAPWWMMLMMTAASWLYDAFCCTHYSLRLLSVQHLGLMREEVFIVCATHSLQWPLKLAVSHYFRSSGRTHCLSNDRQNKEIMFSHIFFFLPSLRPLNAQYAYAAL